MSLTSSQPRIGEQSFPEILIRRLPRALRSTPSVPFYDFTFTCAHFQFDYVNGFPKLPQLFEPPTHY